MSKEQYVNNSEIAYDCKFGHTMGEDFEKFPECEIDCSDDDWDKCEIIYSKKVIANGCKFGHTIGEDFKKFPECKDDCPVAIFRGCHELSLVIVKAQIWLERK